MKILLIGAHGQLAQDILTANSLAGNSKAEIVPVTHEQLEICDSEAVTKLVEQTRPDCIINTAAFHQVDRCEDEPEAAFAVNQGGVANLAQAAEKHSALLVQFSTDYVFDGSRKVPYSETEEANPLSVYGKSRLAGEVAVQKNCSRYLIIRTCGLYGLAGSPSKSGNFVETMLRLGAERRQLKVVDDQVCTPTSTAELASRLLPLIRSGAAGLFHLTNAGQCSWYEFAKEIFRVSGLSLEVVPTSSAEYAAKAKRPTYSVLDNKALRDAGFPDFKTWQEALRQYLDSRGRHS